MRILEIGSRRFTSVVCLDERGQGDACHEYEVHKTQLEDSRKEIVESYAKVSFQNGPVKEAGINGCHNEDLIAIVIDRLESFQSGEYKCRENAIALTKLEEAIHWLKHRTSARQARGVEGTNTV